MQHAWSMRVIGWSCSHVVMVQFTACSSRGLWRISVKPRTKKLFKSAPPAPTPLARSSLGCMTGVGRIGFQSYFQGVFCSSWFGSEVGRVIWKWNISCSIFRFLWIWIWMVARYRWDIVIFRGASSKCHLFICFPASAQCIMISYMVHYTYRLINALRYALLFSLCCICQLISYSNIDGLLRNGCTVSGNAKTRYARVVYSALLGDMCEVLASTCLCHVCGETFQLVCTPPLLRKPFLFLWCM